MSNEEINRKIAQHLGWTDVNFYEDNAGPGFWNGFPPAVISMDARGEWEAKKEEYHKPLPDYCSDLNAMHAAEETLGSLQVPVRGKAEEYLSALIDVCGVDTIIFHATAMQRALAFLKTVDAKL